VDEAVYTARDTERGVPLGVRAYAELKRRLLVGDFTLTTRLAESTLAEALGMSRTPVREALSRLHAEGLVARQPDGGFVPAAPDLHTIAELYEVRRSLEFTALRRGRHDTRALHDLRAEWEGLAGSERADPGPDFVLLDESFHVQLAAAAGNEALVEILVGVNERIRIVRMHDFLTPDRVEATVAEHTGIVAALLDGGAPRAAPVLTEHLEVSERVVEKRAAAALSRMVGARRG
jgi:DNA-binding GntR family transcriptional regulator